MARVIRKTDPSLDELATMVNDMKAFVTASVRSVRADLVSIASDAAGYATPALADPGAHNDQSEKTIDSDDADGGDDDDGLAGCVTLVNEMLSWHAFHMADTLAHKVVGVALASYVPVGDSLSDATKLSTSITRANDIKSKYNTHRASTTYHYTADGTNDADATNASDLASLITLVNQLKEMMNLHAASGVAAKSVRLVSA